MQSVDRPADKALLGIVGANALTLLMALWQGWGVLQLLWPYWIQSAIIGGYARKRMLRLETFSTESLRLNNRPVEPTRETQQRVARFFVLHYGLFHLGYLAFLWTATTQGLTDGTLPITDERSGEIRKLAIGTVQPIDWLIFAVLAASFWHSHRASHREHVEADLARVPNLGTLMMMPYARVLPMHLTIIFGAYLGGGATWLFVLLKTGADVAMHRLEHQWLQAGGSSPNA